MNRIQLSKNFYLDEFLLSQVAERYGIDMSIEINGSIYRNLKHLCKCFLQPIRDHFGPVFISSGYRPPELNTVINGARNSSHLYGAAADFVVSSQNQYEVALWISANMKRYGYEQLIYEFGRWIHLSIPVAERDLKNRVDLTAIKKVTVSGPKPQYLQGIVNHASFQVWS